ncbi:methyltransferase domain-containing protein [Streptomyces sp. ML-6]|uniref:methyltransferase domain-containing protein n=1 Tax=Streptomyces sp. ML-6 TaxID=2982693 RepID=UPI0024C06D24|nr:methyltransferase domain-containing protein [Streptomyces sp. ML-6]MDK0523970.1 methyltransferase domain-containing protein [Streptomyces sp. ML-6]
MADDHTHVQEFFTARAVDWDARFADDGPAFDEAVRSLGLGPGDAVLDAGCGTGRALPALRAAVGPHGTVVGVDLTAAMLESAVRPGGRLALFHPVGRAALAARHGRRLTGDDLRAEHNLRPLPARSGWRLDVYADEDERFLALAVRLP